MCNLGQLVLVAALAFLGHTRAEENVVTLTSDNFDEVVGKAEFAVVEFYAPWCGHCKKLAPEYEKAATAFKQEGSSVVLAKVDATADNGKSLSTKYGIRGYPTLKIFRGGDIENPSEYEGPRESSGIIKYIKKVSGPASALLSSADEVSKFKQEEDVPVIAYFDKAEGEGFEAYSKQADKLRSDYGFAHVTDSSLIKDSCDACSSGSVVAFNKVEQTSEVFKGDMAEFKDWVAKTTKPTVITFGESMLMRKALGTAFAPGAPTKVVGIAEKDSETSAVLDALRAQHKENGDLTFMYADSTMQLYDRVKPHFGVEDSQLPAFVIQNDEGKWHFFNADPAKLGSYITEWKEGKIEKTIKSADIPSEPYEDDVRVVVAKNFDEVVFSGNDVLIEFYAPWCGHCKSLAPTYSKVAAKYKKNDKVEVAKMDATANDVPSSKFDVKGFPTIYFVKGGKDVIPYEGARSEDAFHDFIKKHATASAGTHDEL